MNEIAKAFNTTEAVVARHFQHAAENGMLEKLENLEDKLIQELVPLALTIYKAKLDEGDVYVAKDVIDKMVRISDRMASKQQHQQSLGLEAYVKLRKLENAENETSPQEQHSEGDIVEAAPVGGGKQITETAVSENSVKDSLS